MMNKCYRILFLMVFSLLMTSGCHRLASTSSVDLTRFTPGAAAEVDLEVTSTPEPDAARTQTLASAAEQVLEVYPLWVGSSWVYAYLGYDESREVIWQVVESVVSADTIDGYYIVAVERTAELEDGYAPEDFPSSPETGTFWYLVDGGNIYRYEMEPDYDPSSGWLELVIPFPADGEAWYPDPEQRAESSEEEVCSRSASEPFERVLPTGGTYTCYYIATQYEDRVEEGIFCEGVGFVYKESTHADLTNGYRMELEAYSLQ